MGRHGIRTCGWRSYGLLTPCAAARSRNLQKTVSLGNSISQEGNQSGGNDVKSALLANKIQDFNHLMSRMTQRGEASSPLVAIDPTHPARSHV
eukprot:6486402-Amphidinium_carterae.1